MHHLRLHSRIISSPPLCLENGRLRIIKRNLLKNSLVAFFVVVLCTGGRRMRNVKSTLKAKGKCFATKTTWQTTKFWNHLMSSEEKTKVLEPLKSSFFFFGISEAPYWSQSHYWRRGTKLGWRYSSSLYAMRPSWHRFYYQPRKRGLLPRLG